MTIAIVYDTGPSTADTRLTGWQTDLLRTIAGNASATTAIQSSADVRCVRDSQTLEIRISGELADLSSGTETAIKNAVGDKLPDAEYVEMREV